jgi:hypothetical protein
MGRDVGSGTTVKVSITGEYSDPEVDKLIKNLAFHLEDTGNEDYPWPWEGEALFYRQRTLQDDRRYHDNLCVGTV